MFRNGPRNKPIENRLGHARAVQLRGFKFHGRLAAGRGIAASRFELAFAAKHCQPKGGERSLAAALQLREIDIGVNHASVLEQLDSQVPHALGHLRGVIISQVGIDFVLAESDILPGLHALARNTLDLSAGGAAAFRRERGWG